MSNYCLRPAGLQGVFDDTAASHQRSQLCVAFSTSPFRCHLSSSRREKPPGLRVFCNRSPSISKGGLYCILGPSKCHLTDLWKRTLVPGGGSHGTIIWILVVDATRHGPASHSPGGVPGLHGSLAFPGSTGKGVGFRVVASPCQSRSGRPRALCRLSGSKLRRHVQPGGPGHAVRPAGPGDRRLRRSGNAPALGVRAGS